eukprot:INCI16897.1.p1 GENE.INCI16897.1~~INCI16897.1.p1  ORF type:complete len:704 (-),score=149.23 INCI16897.1:146-2176(-)
MSAAEPERKRMRTQPAASSSSSGAGSCSDVVLKHGEPALTWLLGDQISAAQFFEEYWGKKPLIIRRSAMQAAAQVSGGSESRISTSEATHYYTGVFDRIQARDAVVDNELRQFADFAACKYEDSERVNLDAVDGENGDSPVTADQFDNVLDTGNTIQFFQPQRYSDLLWDVQSHLETLFGCLVGSSAYLTPPNTQGLAPHHDDVDVFILQTEGTKKWKLYAPIQVNARTASHDLPRVMIGKPTHEFTLHQGDMLYFPRGVVHEAAATEQFSTHVTISTYQRYAHVDFLQASLPLFLEKCAEDDEHATVKGIGQKLRAGLPLRSVYNFGARQFHSAPDEPEGAAAVARSSLVQELKGLIHAIADSLDENDVHSVMDTWALDFVANRLPPFPPERSLFHIPDPAFGPNAPADQRIVSRSALMSASGIPLSSAAFAAHKLSFHKYPLRLRSAHLLRMRETEEAVILHHPFHNSRRWHMGGRVPQAAENTEDDVSLDLDPMSDFVPAPSDDEDERADAATSATGDPTEKTPSGTNDSRGNATNNKGDNSSANAIGEGNPAQSKEDDEGEDEDIAITLRGSDEDESGSDEAEGEEEDSEADDGETSTTDVGAIMLPHEATELLLELLEQGRKFAQHDDINEEAQEVRFAWGLEASCRSPLNSNLWLVALHDLAGPSSFVGS